jgi:hypothetical protein
LLALAPLDFAAYARQLVFNLQDIVKLAGRFFQMPEEPFFFFLHVAPSARLRRCEIADKKIKGSVVNDLPARVGLVLRPGRLSRLCRSIVLSDMPFLRRGGQRRSFVAACNTAHR